MVVNGDTDKIIHLSNPYKTVVSHLKLISQSVLFNFFILPWDKFLMRKAEGIIACKLLTTEVIIVHVDNVKFRFE